MNTKKNTPFIVVVAVVLFAALNSFAAGLPMGSSAGASTGTFATTNSSQGIAGASFMNMQLPLFLGGAFGIGSGAGVGDGNDVGLCQIRPTIGAWFPGLAFVRLGYGFSSYEEIDDDDKKNEVSTSNFSVEAGMHLLSEFYVTGSYTRANALSENGDISWNEWSVGIGTFWAVFARTMLTMDVGYHWVLEHYDPFIDKKVSGGRIQMNLGFVVFVY